MGQGISEVLAYAVGVSSSLLGWVLALAIVSGLAHADQANASTSTSAANAIAWGKIVFGVRQLPLALRNWRKRPAPGTQSDIPKWMGGIDALSGRCVRQLRDPSGEAIPPQVRRESLHAHQPPGIARTG